MSIDPKQMAKHALALKDAGRLEEAIDLLRQVVAQMPASGVAEHNLAAALADAERWAEAERHIRQALAKGIDAPELSIENGAGLSRTERISPRTMGRMLVAAFQSPTMPEFVGSLSLVGHDGTMRQRLTNHTVAGKAHIKTGLLNDARAVAGYVLAASGKRYVVVCLINHVNAQRGNEAQDALLQWVYERG